MSTARMRCHQRAAAARSGGRCGALLGGAGVPGVGALALLLGEKRGALGGLALLQRVQGVLGQAMGLLLHGTRLPSRCEEKIRRICTVWRGSCALLVMLLAELRWDGFLTPSGHCRFLH
jgi:hypothetical protein